jgi:hypothetical protein
MKWHFYLVVIGGFLLIPLVPFFNPDDLVQFVSGLHLQTTLIVGSTYVIPVGVFLLIYRFVNNKMHRGLFFWLPYAGVMLLLVIQLFMAQHPPSRLILFRVFFVPFFLAGVVTMVYSFYSPFRNGQEK